MFDDNYYNHAFGPRYRLDIPSRLEVFATREVEAMARLASDSVYIVLLHKDGINGETSRDKYYMLPI